MSTCCSEIKNIGSVCEIPNNTLLGIIVLPEHGRIKLYSDHIEGSQEGVNRIFELEKVHPGFLIEIYNQLFGVKSLSKMQSDSALLHEKAKELTCMPRDYDVLENYIHDQPFNKFRSNPSKIPISKLKTKSHSSVRKQNYISNGREKRTQKVFIR